MQRLRGAEPVRATAPARRWSRPLAWAAVFILSGAAAVRLLHREPAVAPSDAARPQSVQTATAPSPPVVTQEHLLAVRPLGLLQDADNRVVRLVEYTWLDLQTSGPGGGGASALRREVVPVRLPVQ